MEKPRQLSPTFLNTVPPREAWKNPDKWLKPLSPDEQIKLPTDDRGFVQVDNAFDRFIDLFKPTYKWEYNPKDRRTIPDLHHYYYYESEWRAWGDRLEASEDDYEIAHAKVPMDFRNNPTNIGYMLRGHHVALEHVSLRPDAPRLEHMVSFISHYRLAQLAFTKIAIAAEGILDSTNLIQTREIHVRSKPDIIGGGVLDIFGRQILSDKLNRRQSYMQQSLKEFMGVENNGIIMPDGQTIYIDDSTPLETIIHLKQRARGFTSRDHRPR